MVGAIIGDIVGSIYEFDNIKTKEFELFDKNCIFTDDTVMTIAVADAIAHYSLNKNISNFKRRLVRTLYKYGNLYPSAGYGGRFMDWLEGDNLEPYNSCGNGSAMRVSSVGWYAHNLKEAEDIAAATSEVTHNHPEGIKGAQAVAGAIFLARTGHSKEEIRAYVVNNYYNIDFTLDDIRPYYEFEVICQKSVPQAFQAFFESTSFEDAIRNAISIGGDSDTIAAITGSIAEAYYGVDEEIRETALSFLDDYLLDVYENIIKKI